MLKKITYIIVLVLMLPICSQGQIPQIENIPKNDLETLENFFSYIVHQSSLGYCLCSDKPIATVSVINISNISKKHAPQVPKIIFEYYGYSVLKNGWQCWNRYAHLFPSEKFILRSISGSDTLVLINKPSCKKVIEENIDLFQKQMVTSLNAGEIYETICSPKKEFLFKDTCLLGILYGFGRNNSLAYSNKSYVQKLEIFSVNDLTHPILGYGFVIINNGTNEKENKKVKKLFSSARKKVHESFSQRNNFETFLKFYQG